MKNKINKINKIIIAMNVAIIFAMCLGAYIRTEGDIYVYESLTSPYARFIDVYTGQVYDSTKTSLLSSTTTWSDTVYGLANCTTVQGGWKIMVPPGLPSGTYDIPIYDSVSPSNTDKCLFGFQAKIKGGRIVEHLK